MTGKHRSVQCVHNMTVGIQRARLLVADSVPTPVLVTIVFAPVEIANMMLGKIIVFRSLTLSSQIVGENTQACLTSCTFQDSDYDPVLSPADLSLSHIMRCYARLPNLALCLKRHGGGGLGGRMAKKIPALGYDPTQQTYTNLRPGGSYRAFLHNRKPDC